MFWFHNLCPLCVLAMALQVDLGAARIPATALGLAGLVLQTTELWIVVRKLSRSLLRHATSWAAFALSLSLTIYLPH